jgi:hypothetical protein
MYNSPHMRDLISYVSVPGVGSAATMTSVQSHPAIGKMLGTLVEEAKRLDIRKFHCFLEGNLETDDYRDIVENLETLTDVMMDLI